MYTYFNMSVTLDSSGHYGKPKTHTKIKSNLKMFGFYNLDSLNLNKNVVKWGYNFHVLSLWVI